jgi:hypothetical protein
MLWASYYTFQMYNQSVEEKMPLSQVFNFASIFPPVILLVEAVCYLIFRKRLFIRRFVRLHIWMTIISSILFPILQAVIFAFFIQANRNVSEMAQISKDYRFVTFYSGWALFAIARGLFIVTFIKSVVSVEEKNADVESTGLLDEFSNKQ